jgi:hypothetical protein
MSSNKLLHPVTGTIFPHLLLIGAQLFFVGGPRYLPYRRALATAAILALAVTAQFHRFTHDPGLANFAALAWPHWLSAIVHILFASPGGPEADLWRTAHKPGEASAWPAFSLRKLKWALVLLLNLRGVRWSFQVKNLPKVAGLDRMTRRQFLQWRLAELGVVLLMADFVSQMAVRLFYTDVRGHVGELDSKIITIRDSRLAWGFIKAVAFGLGPYFFINMQYLMVSIVGVLIGVTQPAVRWVFFSQMCSALLTMMTGLAAFVRQSEASNHGAELLGRFLASNATQGKS